MPASSQVLEVEMREEFSSTRQPLFCIKLTPGASQVNYGSKDSSGVDHKSTWELTRQI